MNYKLAMTCGINTAPMSALLGTLMLASVLPVGCGAPAASAPVSSLAEVPAAAVATTQVRSSLDSHLVPSKVTPSNVTPSKATPPLNEPLRYGVRKAITTATAEMIPPVLLSASHAKLCQVKVGDLFPALSLPRLGGATTELAALRGQQATVVLFWHPDRWMARTALTDMQRDIASQFDSGQVAVFGIAVEQPAGAVQNALNQFQATFPQLLDTNGQALAAVGTAVLPRLYVLDPAGKIVWFDIEYSEGTRRELWQTLRVLTKAR